jgi:hypothetical protein
VKNVLSKEWIENSRITGTRTQDHQEKTTTKELPHQPSQGISNSSSAHRDDHHWQQTARDEKSCFLTIEIETADGNRAQGTSGS